MANEMRDRLVESMAKRFKELHKDGDWNFNEMLVGVADYLLDDGWIRPPCKVGDTVYVIMETSCEDIDGVHTVCEFYKIGYEDLCTVKGKCPYLYRIAECLVTEINLLSFTERWNKTVFLTKAEAEQKLKEMRGGNG